MSASAETKLLVVLGLVVLLGVGALFGIKMLTEGPEKPPTPPPSLTLDNAAFEKMVSGARHTKGDPGAEVTVVEFADFQCPSCRRAYHGSLSRNLKDPSRPFYFVFRHFPLPNHEFAEPAAVASEAAARQGKFWEMYQALFADKDAEVNPSLIQEAANKAGLDMAKFEKAMSDPELKALVEADRQLAEASQISYTPTFVVRDQKGNIKSVVGGDELGKLLDQIYSATAPDAPATGEAGEKAVAPTAN